MPFAGADQATVGSYGAVRGSCGRYGQLSLCGIQNNKSCLHQPGQRGGADLATAVGCG
jgi:hypothetical protein